MAFDEQLAERVRKQLARQAGLSEKKMFGGLGFLINGNMSRLLSTRGEQRFLSRR